MNRVEDVFGVNKNLTTYLERENVDGKMKSALSEKKHVVIYGSSKQGKTLLLDRMNIENKIIVNIGDSTKTIDIYKSIIRQLELKIMGKIVSSTGSGTTAKAEASLSAKVPFLGKASAGIDGGIEYKESQEIESSYVGYDFNQAQSIVEMIRKQKKHKIIIDDFHYLNLEEQKKR
ncbi:hypothetical protein MX634_10395 [Carnobacterium maltaromaticum]|uniref:hypothetical protein n=1 Tax=Carnobacterium maltaromaticum TaxID=2751 RepID=UPI00288EEAD2|nr:hypothetical protein [Carnobacterium maltaromaticum]MDT1945384.1 hypothetical protein [Carnobacterium maltaromaticum]